MKEYKLSKASKKSGIKQDDFILFYVIRGYIRKETYGYSATALGIEKGCVVNDKNNNALFTTESIIRISDAFAA